MSDSRRSRIAPSRPVRLVVWGAIAAAAVGGWLARRGERASQPPMARGPRPKLRAPKVFDPIADRPEAVGPVTYAGDVAAIVQSKCAGCHRPGQVAPFALRTYEDARRRASLIAEVVADRRMPPWHADPRHGRFANDRSLSPRERNVLLAWADQGAPPGDLAAAPPARDDPQEWTIGTPDVVFAMAEPFLVPAEGVVNYQKFRVPTHFREDVWVQAAEARPGDRRVVHHLCVFLDEKVANAEGRAERPELVCYAPGDMPSVFPPGSAKRVPAGSTLILEVHYTPIGTERPDRSRVGLIFARGPIRHRATTQGISRKDFKLAPGEADREVRSTFSFPWDARLLSLSPHMHYRGRDFRYTAFYPDGRSEVLLNVPAYDFAWQSVYRLIAPKPMPRGTRIDCVAHFDNSAANPVNPDPAATVRWGEQIWDEMMIGYIDYDVAVPAALAGPPPTAPARR